MESNCHIKIKKTVCNGKTGTETRLPSGKRLDCCEPKSKTCTEVELHKTNLKAAISRLDEGSKLGRCSKSNLVTTDKLVPEAKKLVGNRNIRIVSLSTMNPTIRFT